MSEQRGLRSDFKRELMKRLEGMNLRPEQEAGIVEEIADHLEDGYHNLISAQAATEEAFAIALESLHDQ